MVVVVVVVVMVVPVLVATGAVVVKAAEADGAVEAPVALLQLMCTGHFAHSDARRRGR